MKLKRWEIALAVALAICLGVAAVTTGTQAALSDKLIRLHVIANSDSEADQALKLRVRDAALAVVTPDDGVVTDDLLARMERAGTEAVAAAGLDFPVSVTRQRMYFDTRDYGTFALPAGYYDAVRMTIGAGAGKNWWCVLFPPLCRGVCEDDLAATAAAAGLTGDEIAFIRGDGVTYVARFKIAEIFGEIRNFFGG